MWIPRHFAHPDPDLLLATLRTVAFGHLVTAGAPGADTPGPPTSTPVPFVIDDEMTRARMHVAHANPHWRDIDGAMALLIVPATDTYVSPRWYPSKADHGRVVPTWNYEVVHLGGRVEVIHDPDTKLDIVRSLTDHNESQVPEGATWSVDDAPADFIERQLEAIVGLALHVTSVKAKQKYSQNKSSPDRDGVIAGLGHSQRERDRSVARGMQA